MLTTIISKQHLYLGGVVLPLLFWSVIGLASVSLKEALDNLERMKEFDEPDQATGRTPLLDAADHGNIGKVKTLIATGLCNLNHADKSGKTMVMILARGAASKPKFQILKYLLETEDLKEQLDLDMRNIEANTALMAAARYAGGDSSSAAVRILAEAGANLDLQQMNGWTALLFAIRYGADSCVVEVVSTLLSLNPDLLMISRGGSSALECAYRRASGQARTEILHLIKPRVKALKQAAKREKKSRHRSSQSEKLGRRLLELTASNSHFQDRSSADSDHRNDGYLEITSTATEGTYSK